LEGHGDEPGDVKMSTGYMLNRWQRDESVSWLPGVKFKDGLARVALGHQNDAHQETKKLFLVFWRWRPRRFFDECDVEAAQIFWLNQQRKVFQLREEELFSSAITKRISTIVQ
jgi:hypothetical protein